MGTHIILSVGDERRDEKQTRPLTSWPNDQGGDEWNEVHLTENGERLWEPIHSKDIRMSKRGLTVEKHPITTATGQKKHGEVKGEENRKPSRGNLGKGQIKGKKTSLCKPRGVGSEKAVTLLDERILSRSRAPKRGVDYSEELKLFQNGGESVEADAKGWP